ncbi:hypothetical protein Emtol_3946 [Emticicia oligotrophica DSM 17448]|uniref:Glycosyl transferase n=1 Tax=Emticicia oligotrophica (strain DSM 17448 / CIP 109782 / MTCC 6937 / GPTSA100-15) TaxID=929562 RepID=A0ABM5N6C9_EMTOG|nr:hypothetical protein [Emticicia oligotrophica]AFK05072.1 hypothetical protein Emtol_3946 [Emticicia oligotrophica DSM 17448]
MNIFTICHINQLANACILGDSLKKTNPNATFSIGLVDEISQINETFKTIFEIIPVQELGIEGFNEMSHRYTHEELLANCKPFFAEYFLKKSETLLYIDCTSLVFQSLQFIEDILQTSNILITPQLLFANKHPDEKQILNSGIYHSGFIGLKNTEETFRFLSWWGNNTRKKGFINLCKGMNADQLWLEHVPAMFEEVFILKNEGVNVGYWNLPERNLEILKKEQNLISLNYKKMEFSKEYDTELNNYSYKKLLKFQPAFGINDPNKPTLGKTIARKIRLINNQVDTLIDKILG